MYTQNSQYEITMSIRLRTYRSNGHAISIFFFAFKRESVLANVESDRISYHEFPICFICSVYGKIYCNMVCIDSIDGYNSVY